jgi:hypothetical protein
MISWSKPATSPLSGAVSAQPFYLQIEFAAGMTLNLCLAEFRAGGGIPLTWCVVNSLPKKFTMTELQEVYEAILGKKLDKRRMRSLFLAQPRKAGL